MKIYIKIFFAIVAMLIAFASCKKQPNLTPEPTKEVEVKVPTWYTNPPKSQDTLYAVTTATSRDIQLSVNKAKQDGRNEIAQQMELRIKSLSKKFAEETGVNEDSQLLSQFTEASKIVVSNVLNGTSIIKQETMKEKEIWRVYVLTALPIGEANRQLMEKIKANELMYTNFRATQTYKELDEETKKYEEYKKGNR